MKNINTIIACFLLVSLVSCRHHDLVTHCHSGGEVAFFKFADSTLVNKAIICFDTYWCDNDFLKLGYLYAWRKDRYIPTYPKNIAGTPLFGESEDGTYSRYRWMMGEKYTAEDLVNTPKYIALKGGYYICWPFTQLAYEGCYTNVEWKDLLTADLDTVHIITDMPYVKRYIIHEAELVKLTHKSTKHFHGFIWEEITIEDVVNVLNELIETETIDEYCSVAYLSYKYQ